MLNENGTIIAYDGDDTTEDFPFVSSTGEAIHFREYSHVHGIEIDTNGVETPVVFSTNYEISGKPNNGVLHRIDGPLPTGYKLIIWREQPIEQSVRFGTGGNFRASDHEAAADNIVQMLQEIRFDVARSIKLPRQAKLQDVEVPLVDGQAPVVHIDVDGNASIQGEDPGGDGSGGGSVSEFAQTILQADNALEAQEALGLTPGREIVGGYAIAKHHGGGRWRAFWSTDQSRIVVYGDTVGLGIDPAGDNWGPFVIAWSPLTNGNITAMYAGTNYLLIQTDLATGNLFHIGYTDNGQGGNGLTAGYSLEPQRITKFVTDAVKIADVTTEGNVDQVEKFWFAVTTGGAVYSCGYSGSQHVMGYNSATNLSTPRKMTLSDGTTALADVTEIYAATAYAPVWARTSTRKAYRWGAGTDGAHGDNSTSAMTWPEYLETFAGSGVAREDIAEVAVSGGSSDTTHACSWILTTDGNVLSAGANNYGNGNGASLGDTDQTTFTAATGAIASVTVEKIRAGGGSRPICVAITDDGDIYLVGRNGAGLRGSGSTADLSEFTKIVDLATGFDGNVVDARVAGAYKTSADYSVLYIEALVNGATKISGIGYDTEYAPGAGSTGVAANLRTHEIVLNLPDTITSWQSVGDATVFGLEVTTGIGEVWYVGGNDQGQAGHMPGNMHAVVTMQPSNRVAGQGNGVPLATVAAATATAAATTASAAATSASASATASASSAAAAAASEASASTSAGAASASAAVAQAAAESSGNINYYDTKADADAALSGLAEDQVVEVFIDETRNDNRTRYRVESGVYVYKFTFPTAKPIPADSFVAATDKGVIQAALNFAGLSPGSTVQLTPGRTYTLTHTGTKSFESGTHRYCVEIPAGVRLDLNGATVKLDDAQNSALFMNAGAGTTQDFGTQVYGGTLDGNETNQTDGGSSSEMPLIFMYDCDHIEIRHIRAVNARDGFGRFIKDRDSTFDYLWGKRSDGYGWSFGVYGEGQGNLERCRIDHIYAEDCAGDYPHPTGEPGNGIIFTVNYCTIGMVHQKNCEGGVKIQDDSSYTMVDTVIVEGGANTTENAGFKLQGADGQRSVIGVHVGRVITKDNLSQALYFSETTDCYIGSYHGTDNVGVGATAVRDVVIRESTRPRIGNIVVTNGNVLIADTVDDYEIGTIAVSGTITTNIAVQDESLGDGNIGSIVAIDTQGTPTLQYAYRQTGTGGGHIGSVKTNVDFSTTYPAALLVQGSGKTIGKIVNGSGDPTADVVQLTDTDTSTVVANDNVYKVYLGASGNYMEPVIEIQAHEADGQVAIGSGWRVVMNDISAGGGFTIHHGTAGNSDYVHWRIAEWRVKATAAT